MKKIINGRKYNTETATKVAEWSNDYGPNDFRYCIEVLYRKRTGEYFVHGEGGAMSCYAKAAYGGGYFGGESIVPLTSDEAREWGERHMDVDDYEAEFGEVDE